MAFEFPHGTQPETRGGVALLIGQHFGMAKARAVIDRHVNVLPTSLYAAAALAGDPMPGLSETPELLDVDMHQLTGALPLVALQRHRLHQVAQPVLGRCAPTLR